MNKNGLTYGMAFFFLISFVLLGLILVNEKKLEIITPKVEEKLNQFIEENDNMKKEELKYNKVKYNKKKKRFEQKVENKKNKHLYFYLYYKNKQITSTYKEDYVKGKTLLSHLEESLSKELKETVKIKTPLDQFTEEIKEYIQKEENLKSLKIYTIEKEIKVPNLDPTSIIQSLNEIILEQKKKEFTPKNYSLTLTNSTDITQSVKIDNLVLPNNNINEIITAIITNDKTIETKYNIKYKFLN